MEALIAETVAQRKFDIEQIHGPIPSAVTNSGIKKKVSFDINTNTNTNNDNTSNEVYNNNDNDNNNNDINNNDNNNYNLNNIFSKLKKTTIKEPNINVVLDTDLIETTGIDPINKINSKIDILISMMSQMSATLDLLMKK